MTATVNGVESSEATARRWSVGGFEVGRAAGQHRKRRERNPMLVGVLGLCVAGVGAVVLSGWAAGRAVPGAVEDAMGAYRAQLEADVVATIDARVAAAEDGLPKTIVAGDPTAWFPCPVSSTARAVITLDPATQFSTLEPQRAGEVAQQVQALIAAGAPIGRMRLVAADDGVGLRVVDGGVEGTPLFACAAGAGGDEAGSGSAAPAVNEEGS